MDYQTQQYKLLPLIATTYAILMTGQYMLRLYTEMKMEISQGNFDSLPEVRKLKIINTVFLLKFWRKINLLAQYLEVIVAEIPEAPNNWRCCDEHMF